MLKVFVETIEVQDLFWGAEEFRVASRYYVEMVRTEDHEIIEGLVVCLGERSL